jgi:hypothetical protein
MISMTGDFPFVGSLVLSYGKVTAVTVSLAIVAGLAGYARTEGVSTDGTLLAVGHHSELIDLDSVCKTCLENNIWQINQRQKSSGLHLYSFTRPGFLFVLHKR